MKGLQDIETLSLNDSQRSVLKNYAEALRSQVNPELPLSEKIAQKFMVTVQHFSRLQECMAGHTFRDAEEEIYFFKHIKPFFTARIELYTLQFKGLVFAPTDPIDAREYWELEAARLASFEGQYPDFVVYVRKGRTDKDAEYFRATMAAEVPVAWRTAYDVEDHFSSSHDPLLAILLSLEAYHRFAVAQLDELLREPA